MDMYYNITDETYCHLWEKFLVPLLIDSLNGDDELRPSNDNGIFTPTTAA